MLSILGNHKIERVIRAYETHIGTLQRVTKAFWILFPLESPII